MNVTRAVLAPDYTAPKHFFMRCQRLQGMEAGISETLWIGLATLMPGAHTAVDVRDMERHYVVLEGEVTFITDNCETVLRQHDSCRIASGERCAIHNGSGSRAKLLIAAPLGKPLAEASHQS